MIKDYYKILDVPPNASAAEIKKSYRRLAFKYHPDKNFGNHLSEAHFKEIQEAYRVLSNDRRRSDYNYKRNTATNGHWHSETKARPHQYASPATVVTQVSDFRKKVTVLDPNRMNKVALFQQIQHLLSKQHILLLQQQNDMKINRKVIDDILFCSRFLTYAQVEKICFQLTAIAGADNKVYQRIYHFSKQARLNSYWNKYKLLVALLATILLCIAIFKISNSLA